MGYAGGAVNSPFGRYPYGLLRRIMLPPREIPMSAVSRTLPTGFIVAEPAATPR